MPRRVAALAAPLALAAAAAAQDVPASRVELVRLDVVVTDKQGQLVRGLSQADFVVLEDGRPQRLTHFVQAGRAAPAASPPPAPPEPPSAGEPAEVSAPRGPGRVVVIVVDDLHIAPSNLELVRQALSRMLAEFVLADDRVGMIASGAVEIVQPTTDRAALRRAIAGLQARAMRVHPASGSHMTPVQAELILAGDPAALRLASQTLLAQPSNLMANVPLTVEDRQRTAENEVQRQARAVLAESLRFSSATLSTLFDVLGSLAPHRGRKLCLLVSDGFLTGTGTSEDRQEDLRRIVDVSMRSGAVVYALDSSGLTTPVADAGVAAADVPPGLQFQVERRGEQLVRQTLERVSEDTGGFVVRGTNDLAGGLRRMLDDNEVYYLMAYEPTNTRRDGRFRRIEVRLPQRPGLKVRTRKGYLAPGDRKAPAPGTTVASAPAPSPHGAGRGLDEAEARLLLEGPAGGAIPVRLTADWFDLPPAGPRAVVRAHLDLSGMPWQVSQGHHQATVEILGGLYDADGQPAGAPFGKRTALDLDASQFERVSRSGLQFQELVPLRPGRYQVRLMVHDRDGEGRGGATQWLEVPDLSAGTLAVSSLFLSAFAPGAGASAADSGLSDAHTLRRFQAGQSLYFQLYVYNPLRDEKRRADVVLQAQLLSRGALIAASRARPAALQEKDGVPLPETNGMPLAGLAAGPYELRVVVVDRKANVTATRSVDFTVE